LPIIIRGETHEVVMRARFPLSSIPTIFALVAMLVLALPAKAQEQPDRINPSASVITEQQLLDQLVRIEGRGSIPDKKSYVLEQPIGRTWQVFHQVYLPWIGGVAIVAILSLLAVFYLWRGPLRFEGGRSGRKMLRFTAFERFVHWMTAVCFVVLAISGLNITFGKDLLLPLIGPSAFSTWSQAAKYAHNFLSFPFTMGVVLMFLVWVARNLPTRADVEWMKQGGGMLGGHEPPSYKFNAGEKMIFWIVVIGGGATAATGYLLLFPFYGTDIATMQLAQIVHSVVGVLYIAAMLVHAYMGSIGMEGAFEGMASGEVDVNWAKSHHSLWYEEEMARAAKTQPTATPDTRPATVT
jgi:formate dehydrogenase subunit gamma